MVIAIAAVFAVFMTVKSQKSDHLKWMGSVDAKLSQFGISIQDIKNDIRSLTSNIFDISYRMGSKVADKQSPVRLTDFGQEISKNLDAPNWVKKISDVVQHEVKGMEPYDIQEFSFNMSKTIHTTRMKIVDLFATSPMNKVSLNLRFDKCWELN
ncbi:MAG: hypothetical protein OXF06_12500 [Bacteroidetes bacterium]|nr:hypothetical protein [Bacteroidota bacterium]